MCRVSMAGTTQAELKYVFDGDTVLLHCPEAMGYLYCEPNGHLYTRQTRRTVEEHSLQNFLTVLPSRNDNLPNINFATFCIMHGSQLNESHLGEKTAEPVFGKTGQSFKPMAIVYGSTIKLQHQASGKYLSFSTNQSKLALAYLGDGNSEEVLFQIIPPNQNKGWGENLSVDDRIKLESICHAGNKIQCFDDTSEASYRLKLAMTGSIFSIRSHCHKSVTLNSQSIKGGSVIMLSSIRTDGYVSAKGSFVNRKLPDEFKQRQTRKVGLRRWRHGAFKLWPSSGDTFFQFEKVIPIENISPTSTGDPFMFGENCRIKHLPTQQYISVDENTEVVLEDLDITNESQLFEMMPAVATTTNEVLSSNQIVLKHVKSDKLLSINLKPALQDIEQDHFRQWFNLVLEDQRRKVTLDQGKPDQSVNVSLDQRESIFSASIYEILQIEEDVVLDIHFVTGVTSSFCGYLKKLDHYKSQRDSDSEIALQLSHLFKEITEQVTGLECRFNDPTFYKKKRLASMLRTLQTIDVMIATLKEMATVHKGNDDAKRACCCICTSLRKYIESGNLKCRRYLARSDLLDTLKLTVGKSIGGEKILIALSKDDMPMSNLIQQSFVYWIKQLSTDVMISSDRGIKSWNPDVAELMTIMVFNGRRFNSTIQNAVLKRTCEVEREIAGNTYYTLWEFDEHIINEITVLMETFLSNVDSLEKSGVIANVPSYTSDYYQSSLGHVRSQFDVDLSLCIEDIKRKINQYFLTDERYELKIGNDFKKSNSVIAQLLGIVFFLVDYGAYHNENIPIVSHSQDNVFRHESGVWLCEGSDKVIWLNENSEKTIVPMLIDILDVSNDIDPYGHFNHTDMTLSGNEIVLKIKTLVLLSLRLFLKQLLNMSVESLLLDFKYLRELVCREQTPTDMPMVIPDPPPPPIMEQLLRPNGQEITDECILPSCTRLRQYLKLHGYPRFDIDTNECQTLCNILLDLIDYEDDDIRILSTELLFDIYSVERTMLSDAKGAYFTIASSSQAVYEEMRKVATMTDDDQLLKKMLKGEQLEVVAAKLNHFSKLCVTQMEDGIVDDTEPIASNQGIAYSCGLFAVILEFVLDYGGSLYFAHEDKQHEHVLSSCSTLLQRIARKNLKIQEKLFACFYDFIEVKTPIAPLLNEVFCNNSDLCKKLSEADIELIFFAAIGSNNPEHYEFTVTLRTILENTEPATHLQDYIAKLIQDNWQDYLGHILGESSQEHRLQLLKAKEDCPELQLLLNISDLLGSCGAAEDIPFAESVSESLFTFDELLRILVDENIVVHRKLPFNRILISTYLKTERDSALPCAKLASSGEFWLLVKTLSPVVKDSLRSLRANKHLEIKFKALTERCWSSNQWMAYSADLNEYSTYTNGQLLYAMEGILPLLSAFCKKMSLHLSGGNKACTAVQETAYIKVINDLGEILLLHLEDITIPKRKKSMKQCLLNIASLQLCKPLDFESFIDISSLSSDEVDSAEQSDLDNERIVNQDLHEYIENFSQVYNERSYDKKMDDVLESFTIPKAYSFTKLTELFTKEDHRTKGKFLNVKKLVSILRTVEQKQRHHGLHSVEKASLERVTLMTLQLLCGLISERISKVPKRDLDSQKFWQQYEEIVQPLQQACLDSGVVETLINLVHHHRDDIAFQVLACLNVLLYPGNKAAIHVASLVSQQSRNLFLRVHQMLRLAQSNLNKAVGAVKDQNAVKRNQFVDHRITMALNVISWLCDGQERIMQDALRDSETFGSSNIVGQVSFILHEIANNDIEHNIKVAQSAVQALIEICAGNYKNQQIAFNGQVIFSIDRILRVKNISPSFCKLKSSSIELLEIMLEETDKNSSALIQWIISCLNTSHILVVMFQLWQANSKQLFSSEQLRMNVFRAFHVLRRIADFKNTTVDELVEYKKHSTTKTRFDKLFSDETADHGTNDEIKDAKRMWQYCQHWSRDVEIVYKTTSGEGILSRAYFPYDPHKHLNEAEKDHIHLHIKRNTPEAKLYDLLEWTKAVRARRTWKKKLKNHWIFRGIFLAGTIRHFLLFWLTIAINSIVLFGPQVPSDYDVDDDGTCASNYTCNSSLHYFRPIYNPRTPNWYHVILYILGSLHLILAVWMVVHYYLKHWIDIRFEIFFLSELIHDANNKLPRNKYIYRFLHKINKVLCCGKIRAPHPQPEKCFQIFFLSFEPLYRIFFVFCSALGLATNGYFYCFCMIYLFLRNRVLLYILRAIRKSALQLITVFILGLIVIYIYAVISFALLSNYFNQTMDQFCDTIFQCFITITRFGLLEALGTAISVRPSSDYPPSFELIGWRAIYDIVFFIVIETLGLNIVVAILVDRFSELRQEQDGIDADNESRCFICSIKKDIFERHEIDFHKHCHEDHNVWDYIDYALYLDTVHTKDHNALEKNVWDQLPSKSNRTGSIDFYPMFEAKSLSGLKIPELQKDLDPEQ